MNNPYDNDLPRMSEKYKWHNSENSLIGVAIMNQLAAEIQKEIDKEMLESIKESMLNGSAYSGGAG